MIDFITIDFETANNKRNSVCAVGICIVEKGVIIDTFFSLIRPPRNSYSNTNINIHGITPKQTENAPDFPSVWNEIDKRIKGKLIVAHNAKSMDEKCLYNSLELYDIPYKKEDYKFTDSLELTQTLLWFLKSYRLKDLCKLFSINFDEEKAHNPLYDAQKVAELVCFLSKYFNLNEDLVPVKVEKKKKKQQENVTKEMKDRNRAHGDLLKPNFDIEDKSHFFYGKKVVYTGTFLNFPNRKVIAELIKEVGGDNNNSISSKTDIVILGEAPGPAKLKKIEKFGIKTLNEEEFIALFPNKKI